MARGAGPAKRSVSGGYLPLFTVAFAHGYYNDRGGVCPDFAVVPTQACASLMASLGLLFKDLGTGFVVLVEAARVDALVAWLKADDGRRWTWLSFQLVSTNVNFIGLTNLPITTNTLDQNLHVSNLVTKSANFGDGKPTGAEAFFPLTGAALAVASPSGATATLCDLSGAPVATTSAQGGAGATFNLGPFPAGYYTVAFTNAAGKPVAAPKGAPAGYVYTPGQPGFGLIDLLLAQPAKGVGTPSAFPVVLPAGMISPVSLTLAFAPRDTFWRYYIVSPSTRGVLSPDLAITGPAADFTRSSEPLPNGEQAVVFASGKPLTLQRHSKYRFSLSGQRQAPNGGRDGITVNPLPTAPPAPVWPAASGDPLTGASEIYVYV